MNGARRENQAEEEGVETAQDAGFAFHMSDKWAHCYPGVEVAVVTSIDKPPAPPEGYVPLRLGVHNQMDALDADDAMGEEDIVGFSTDTVLWNEDLLEARLEQITEWTRNAPLSLKEKLGRINWLINAKYSPHAKTVPAYLRHHHQPSFESTTTCSRPRARQHTQRQFDFAAYSTQAPMTSLLLDWLNQELSLHRKVNVLERDLCNGYILAEILHLHGLEAHLERYSDGSDLSIRVANLELLEKAMVAAGLGELGASTKRQIVMENRSSILQLLLRLKAFFESKRTKVSTQQQKLRNIPSNVYEPRSPVKDPTRVVQDVEERFIRETANQYRPKEVRFYKDVNSAIYLRKFPQSQWQNENDQIEYDEKAKANNAKQSANIRAVLRAHMNEKRAFMKDWDKQRLENWQHTQKLYMEAERDDLRLELTLEERRKRFDANKLAKIQADARDGVGGFEKNMGRLGLNHGGAATESGLRAIPASDAGAIAHLDRLDERVKELGFRPSNNVQMMKELRARRTAQLAAEKDRRMRRMKAAGDFNYPTREAQIIQATSDELDADKTEAGSIEACEVTPVNIQDAFIEANREALEANYAHLREIGAAKRELDMDELQRLRLEKRSKINERHKQDCASIVDNLISLAVACQEYQYDAASDPDSVANWKRKMWLEQSSALPSADMNCILRAKCGDAYEELQLLTHTFLNLSNVWAAFTDIQLDTRQQHSTIPMSDQVESFIHDALSPPSPDMLETQWTKLDTSKFVAVFTSDERGHRVAREVAVDHCLYYVNVDELLEDCVQHSYDPVKQADVAASLCRRERELGVFGPKIAALRQKNSPIPDTLAVDVVVAFVVSTQPTALVTETDEDGGQEAPSEKMRDDNNVGFLLHNFPRTFEEWKLFEKAILNCDTPELADDTKAERLIALETACSATPSHYESTISCAVVVSCWAPLSRTPSPSTPGLTPSPSGSELSASAGDRRRTPEPGKRQSVVDPAIAKAEAEQEMLLKRRHVEQLLSRTSRVIRIDQEEMHERVLHELIHLALDTYASNRFCERVGVLVEVGSHSALRSELEAARENRRSGMPINVRLAWMVAAKQLQPNESKLLDVVTRLRRLEHTQFLNLLRIFREAQHALEIETSSSRTKREQLDEILAVTTSLCGAALEKARLDLASQCSQVDKILIATEVALGDAMDAQRIAANQFVDDIAADPHPSSSRAHLQSWLQLLPLVCLESKEFVVDTMHALREGFYSQFEFLRATDGLSPDSSREVLDQVVAAAKALDQCCHESGLQISLEEEVSRMAVQLLITAAEESSGGGYELDEKRIAQQLATAALQRMAAVLRWSTKLVESVKVLHSADVDAMRKYIHRDLSHSNAAIGRAIQQLALEGAASWPDGLAPQRNRSRMLPRHHQAVLLSASQIEALIEALANITASYGSALLSRDEFIAAVVAVARREGFPDVWQDFNHMARVAIAWSSDQSPAVCWRLFVVALVCAQVGECPTMEALRANVDDLSCLSQRTLTDTDHRAPRVTRDEFFSRTTLWFEDSLRSRDEARTWKAVIFSLFAVDSSDSEAEILPMLFALCAVPASSRDVRVELASKLLPHSSRGLRRAFAVLSRWTAASLPSSEETRRLATTQLRPLLQFAGVAIDETRLVETDDNVGSGNNGLGSWRCREDVTAFLAWCDAYDPALAQRITVHDTLAALVEVD